MESTTQFTPTHNYHIKLHDHDVQDPENYGVGSGLGGGHYQNKRSCKAELSAALVLVRTSPRALPHVITGAGFFFFWHLLGITEKKE